MPFTRLAKRAFLGALTLSLVFMLAPGLAQESPPTSSPSTQPDTLPDPPEGQAYAAARKKVELAYADKLKSSDDAIKNGLSAEILASAMETPSEQAAEQYALFILSRQQAEKMGDAEGVGAAIRELGARFKVDQLKLVIAAAPGLTRAKADPVAIYQMYAEIAEAAAQAGDATLVTRALAPADSVLFRIEDKATAQSLRARSEMIRATVRIHPFKQTLEKSPDDPEANYQVGWYLAAKASDWTAALPMLAKGQDAELKSAAQTELAPPATPAAQFELAEAWWKISEGKKYIGAENEAIKQHAGEWYLVAQPEIKGADAKIIESRLAAIAALAGRGEVKDMRGLKYEWFNGENFETKIGERIAYKIFGWYGGSVPGTGSRGDHFTCRWTGYIRAPKPGRYKIWANADDSVRIKLNGKTVIESRGTAIVDFTNEPQELICEFRESTGGAWVHVCWQPPGSTEFTLIPTTAFFQTKEAAKDGRSIRPSSAGIAMTVFGDDGFKKELGRVYDDSIARHFGGLKGSLSVRWRGYIAPLGEGTYRFCAYAPGALAVFIDKKQIMDSGKEAAIELTDEPHELLVEYSTRGDRQATLHWEKPGTFAWQIVPPQVFFTSRAAAARAIAERKKVEKK